MPCKIRTAKKTVDKCQFKLTQSIKFYTLSKGIELMSLRQATAYLILIPIKTVADALQAAVFYFSGEFSKVLVDKSDFDKNCKILLVHLMYILVSTSSCSIIAT